MTDTNWINQYFDESNSPTDRTVVVLSMALIDESLTELLKLQLKPSLAKNESEDALFGFSRPISEISSKIELAYRLGVIDKSLTNILKKLARLRNVAAHKSEKFSFSEGKIYEQLRSLIEISPKQGTNSSMPDLWLRTFTMAFAGSAKSVIDGINNDKSGPEYKLCGVIEVCDDRIIGRIFPEKKHDMNIWDKQ